MTDIRDEWRTPWYVFDYASQEWGPFDADTAATAENALCDIYMTRENDSLTKYWINFNTLWCNPPYSDIMPWIKKAAQAADFNNTRTVMLLPSLMGDRRDDFLLRNVTELKFVVGRIAFLRPDGQPVSGNPRGSVFAVFGRTGHKFRSAIQATHVNRETMFACARPRPKP